MPAKAKTIGKSIQEFRDKHDRSVIIPGRLKAGLAKLADDHWEYETEFFRLCELQPQAVAPFREQFAEYIVVVKGASSHPKSIWCKTPALADRLRKMVL